MSTKLLIMLLATTILTRANGQKTPSNSDSNLIFLENEHLKIGVLTKTGGRMVFFGRPGGENILFADEKQWYETEEEREKPTPFSKFKPYNGWITWVGPQSQWWMNQDVNPERKNAAAIWPPDPYLIYGEFTIINHTSTNITIVGPESPVSGVQLTKSLTLLANTLQISVTAKNIRNSPVSLDIWSNARFKPTSSFRVPATEQEIKRIEYPRWAEKISHTIVDGFFSFVPEAPVKRPERVAKAFIQANAGEMQLFHKNEMLSIQFTPVEETKIHPEQALVEVYINVSPNGVDGLLELEHHSAYGTLQPGETMSLDETWILKTQK